MLHVQRVGRCRRRRCHTAPPLRAPSPARDRSHRPPDGPEHDLRQPDPREHATDMGTQSTAPEAPAEAATDTPTGSPRQPHPTLPEGFGDLDRRAIDTVRVLAMDAV